MKDYIQTSRYRNSDNNIGICVDCKKRKEGCQMMNDGFYGKMYIIETVSAKNKRLRLVSMWKKVSSRSRGNNTLGHTPDNGTLSPASNVIILQNDNKSKPISTNETNQANKKKPTEMVDGTNVPHLQTPKTAISPASNNSIAQNAGNIREQQFVEADSALFKGKTGKELQDSVRKYALLKVRKAVVNIEYFPANLWINVDLIRGL